MSGRPEDRPETVEGDQKERDEGGAEVHEVVQNGALDPGRATSILKYKGVQDANTGILNLPVFCIRYSHIKFMIKC